MVSLLTFHLGKKITYFKEEKPCFSHSKVCLGSYLVTCSRGTPTFPVVVHQAGGNQGSDPTVSVDMYTHIPGGRCLPQWGQLVEIMTDNVRMNSQQEENMRNRLSQQWMP